VVTLRVVLAAMAVAAVALATVPSLSGSSANEAGHELYVANCAACHGENLEGQPNWMERKPDGKLPAPPHDESGHTWHHSDAQLFTITKEGLGALSPGYESDMPAFGGTLTDAEIIEVLDYIKSTWPQRERDYQRARTARD
jgi:mono/diheme cytochrome c family protein